MTQPTEQPDASVERVMEATIRHAACLCDCQWREDECPDVQRAVEAYGRAQQQQALRTIGIACEVCWTSSWAPCEEGTENAVSDPSGGWMVCQMCSKDAICMTLVAQQQPLVAALRHVQTVGHSYKVHCGCTGCASVLTIANSALAALDAAGQTEPAIE